MRSTDLGASNAKPGGRMEPTHETLIRVLAEWNGWKSAEVRLDDLEDVHWRQPNGAPHTLVHAYVHCTQVVSGDLPHDCNRWSLPHRLRVCVLKRHTIGTAYAELARRADEHRSAAGDHHLVVSTATGSPSTTKRLAGPACMPRHRPAGGLPFHSRVRGKRA